MAIRNRKSFTPEFKQDVLNLVRAGDRKTVDIARDLGIRAELIYRWVQMSQERTQEEQEETDVALENKRLRKRLAEVEEERDILKRAMGIFTQRPKPSSGL